MRVIYIAGNGRSGSTLLDMLLGQAESCFSAGELCFITRDGISSEYCSCGKTIGECEVWTKVYDIWAESRQMSTSKYRALRLRYERIKSMPRLIFNMAWPSSDFQAYCLATQRLFTAIQQVTGAKIIIDSSKSAARIAVLRRFSELTVIHLCRNFTGVMNSLSKHFDKDVDQGVEVELHATRPARALISWLLNNMMVEFFGLGVNRKKVSYNQMVNRPTEGLTGLGEDFAKPILQPFSADHMLAGNRIRLRKNVKLDSGVGFRYDNLTIGQQRFGTVIDRMFWFWASS